MATSTSGVTLRRRVPLRGVNANEMHGNTFQCPFGVVASCHSKDGVRRISFCVDRVPVCSLLRNINRAISPLYTTAH